MLLASSLESQGRATGGGLHSSVATSGAVGFTQRAAITDHSTGGARPAATGGRSNRRTAGSAQRRLGPARGRLRSARVARREERRNWTASVAGAAKVVLVDAVCPRGEHAGYHRHTQKNLRHGELLRLAAVSLPQLGPLRRLFCQESSGVSHRRKEVSADFSLSVTV